MSSFGAQWSMCTIVQLAFSMWSICNYVYVISISACLKNSLSILEYITVCTALLAELKSLAMTHLQLKDRSADCHSSMSLETRRDDGEHLLSNGHLEWVIILSTLSNKKNWSVILTQTSLYISLRADASTRKQCTYIQLSMCKAHTFMLASD